MRTLDRLVIATRGSKLARTQAELIRSGLLAAHDGLEVDLLVVSTTGDRDSRPFASIGAKGIFTSEVERAVVEGRADIAVHSAKDLTAELAPGCTIACVPQRASAHDVVVGGHGDDARERLGSLTTGARVGTSSMRRRSLLAEARSDLEPVELRGNLDTRMAKVERGEVDAAILAAAGLERLGLPVAPALDPTWWVPAPAQGALAVEGLASRTELVELLTPLQDIAAGAEVTCERAFTALLEGGCSIPLGCLARASGSELSVVGYIGHPDGTSALRDRISGPLSHAAELGRDLARALLDGGGSDILEELRDQPVPEVVEP
jgi:hydroxymethylbilane synthase